MFMLTEDELSDLRSRFLTANAHRGKSARNRGSVAPRRAAPPDSKSAPLSPHCSVAERRSPLQYVTG